MANVGASGALAPVVWLKLPVRGELGTGVAGVQPSDSVVSETRPITNRASFVLINRDKPSRHCFRSRIGECSEGDDMGGCSEGFEWDTLRSVVRRWTRQPLLPSHSATQ